MVLEGSRITAPIGFARVVDLVEVDAVLDFEMWVDFLCGARVVEAVPQRAISERCGDRCRMVEPSPLSRG